MLPRPLLAAALLLLVTALPAMAAPVEDSSGARAVIELTTDEVLAVLRDGSLTTDQRRARIEQIAYRRFDFDTMSKLVLARNWKRLSDGQKADFVGEFKRYLALNYGSRIDRYDQEEVAFVGERAEPRGDVTVLTRIVGGEFENADVHYRLRETDGEWFVIDVVVEGISLVSNYRAQFKEVMGRGGPDRLLEALREKNERGVPDED